MKPKFFFFVQAQTNNPTGEPQGLRAGVVSHDGERAIVLGKEALAAQGNPDVMIIGVQCAGPVHAIDPECSNVLKLER